MATTTPGIKRQIDRLCALPAQQTEAFGIEPQTIRDDLGEALRRYARDDAHAKRLVDWLLFERAQRVYRPVVGEIRDAAEAVQAAEERQQANAAPPGCQECSGTGWRVVFKGAQEAAQRCDCARGRWLAAEDGKRAQGAV